MRTYCSIDKAYLGALADVWFTYDYLVAPRGLPCREKLNYTFKVLEPTTRSILTMDPERNKVIANYTEKEMALYYSGTNRVSAFATASKFWNKIANPDGTINSAYGFLIWHKKSHGNLVYGDELMTPWDWCVKSLMNDKETRQAILRFSLPEHAWLDNKDQVCTMHGNFSIRDNKLHFSIVMRSNDLVKGTVYDMPFFISLMYKMKNTLQSTYPDLQLGEYTHTAHSMHIYEKDKDVVLKMLGKK